MSLSPFSYVFGLSSLRFLQDIKHKYKSNDSSLAESFCWHRIAAMSTHLLA